NVVLTELPSRSVTLRLTQPVPPANIPALLRSFAQSQGLRLVQEDGFVRVEAADRAAAGGRAEGEAGPNGAAGVRLFVYRLKHARAERLAATLQSLYGGRGAAGGGAGRPARRPTLSDNLRGDLVPPAENGDTSRIRNVAPPALPGLPGDVAGDIQIVADEPTNALLVRAAPGDWEVIRQAIDLLDLRPLQVLIEVVVADVRRSRGLEVGVSARGTNRNAARPLEGLLGLPNDSSITGGLRVRALRLGSLDIDVALTALASSGRVNIVARPVLLAQNNLESKILVGEQRPFVQVSRTLPTSDAVRDQVIQYRDVGTSLTITPTINPDGYVNLNLTQEVSAVAEQGELAPVISTREASTHLFVRDGQTVVIGGLIETQRDRTRSGIPYLKDLPVLGALFGTTRNTSRNSELFLFLTPHIIRSDDDAERLRERVDAASNLPEGTGPILNPAPRPATPATRP
ncbi:MAG TPA: secretin N-terminal domain-containing protein, partial [Longimicrobium sp.]